MFSKNTPARVSGSDVGVAAKSAAAAAAGDPTLSKLAVVLAEKSGESVADSQALLKDMLKSRVIIYYGPYKYGTVTQD